MLLVNKFEITFIKIRILKVFKIMTGKKIILISLFAVFTAGFFNAGKASANYSKENTKPNILFLFTDDHRHSSLGFLGVENVKTPNIDKLADQGIVFLNSHIMGSNSGAVCLPSRAMLMTGKFLHNLEKGGAKIPNEHKMLPEVLKEAGYSTFGTGKWHNGRDSYARCFTKGANIFFGGMSNHNKVPINNFDPSGEYPKTDTYVGKKFSSQLFADAAIDYLKKYNNENPFFAFVSFTAPHDPRMAPKEYVEMYEKANVPVPENFMPEHPFDNGELIIRDELIATFPRTKEIIKHEIAGYYAMITHVDEQIGRILNALDESGNAENTIIVFAGDNGLAVGQHGLVGKQNIYDHSVRIPLIISGPGLEKGKRNNSLCYLNDVYPTLCEMAGISIPNSVESKSLKKLVDNPESTDGNYSSLYFAYKNFQRGIATQDGWKLMCYLVEGKKRTQLFNLNSDPMELNNLADNPEYKIKVQELTEIMQEWADKSGDEVIFSKDDWGVPVISSWVTDRLKKGKPIDGSDFDFAKTLIK
jgi:arylsulfatase A-like enzyme